MIDIEAKDAREVAPLVHTYGIAVWRQLVPKALTDAVLRIAVENLENQASYVSPKGGVMSSGILPAELRRQRALPEMHQAFEGVLGGESFIHDDGKSVSGIYLTARQFKQSHEWHQDTSEYFQDYGACVWVACTDCGVNAPGLTFVLHNPGKAVGDEIDRYIEEYPHVSPAMQAGDAVFFDCYSMHRTHRTPQMTQNRAAYKLSATRFPEFKGEILPHMHSAVGYTYRRPT